MPRTVIRAQPGAMRASPRRIRISGLPAGSLRACFLALTVAGGARINRGSRAAAEAAFLIFKRMIAAKGRAPMSASLAASDSRTKAAAPTTGPSPAVMATYARLDLVFERGEGAWLVAT